MRLLPLSEGEEMASNDAKRRLAAIAAHQHQAFSRNQALQAGFSAEAIRRHIESGVWVKQSPTVYAATDARPTWDRRLQVALLTGGAEAAASHATAAYVLGAREKRPQIIDILIPSRKHALSLPGVRFHRVRMVEATTRSGLRVTSVPRTIVDIADRPELEHVLDTALHKRLTTVARMKEYIKPLKTNPGLRRLRRLLDDREKGSLTTELERRFDALLEHSPLPSPARQHPIGGRFADFAYVDERIVVELDGGDSHMRKEVFEDDRLRQNEMVLAGWLVLRFTWDDVTKRPDYVVRTIRHAIVERSSRSRSESMLPSAPP